MGVYLGVSPKWAATIIREESPVILHFFDALMLVGEVVSTQGEDPSLKG